MTDTRVMKAIDVAAHVETLLPPIADIVQVDSMRSPDDLGPTVTVPAVYLHIIIQGFRGEALSRQHDEMQATIDRASRKPKAALDDDQITELAAHLATEAHALSFDAMQAATSLWKAAATIAVACLPRETALITLDGVHAMTRADVAQAIGMGATKQ